jgi:hypothetical protein
MKDTASHRASNGGKTGWAPNLLQDDSKPLSRWSASRLGAKDLPDKLL